jgi:hypothetical protein
MRTSGFGAGSLEETATLGGQGQSNKKIWWVANLGSGY